MTNTSVLESVPHRTPPFEPIAIVGAGLRLPGGVDDFPGLAALLTDGIDPVREQPRDRWGQHAPDAEVQPRLAHDWGSFLDGLDRFDAAFFGIAPREAASLDPQQRLLLEVAWEALENAGYDPRALAGTNTAVFVGVAASDYGRDMMSQPDSLDAYGASGTAHGTAAGRLSYTLDLRGACLAVDTACSSSLVAIHLAAQSLRFGESDWALAGGVNVVLAPELGMIYAKARMLSPDGRCRSFAADANGYVRGEGCGVLVLRRLADAVAAGDRILGVIRGTAVNQDGRSAGLTAPRGSAQQAVVATALAAAGLQPGDLSYVEAHGSGTPLGDTVEMEALGESLCQDRPFDKPLLIGSIKSNIGHLESAGGVAGVLKVLLAFESGSVPPNLHFTVPNPLIAWDDLPIRVPVQATPWPRAASPRRAGVNSFGFGGTNAHVVLEEPPPPGPAQPPPPAGLLPISARTPEALLSLIRRYRAALDDRTWPAACRTAATGRSHFSHRAAVVGTSAAELRDGLDALLVSLDQTPPVATVPPPLLVWALSPSLAEDAATLARLRPEAPDLAVDATSLQPALAALLSGWGAPARATLLRPGANPADAERIGLPTGPAPESSLVVDLATVATGDAPWRALLEQVRQLYLAGFVLDWEAIHAGTRRAPIAWPTYPFQRRRHWSPAIRAFATPPDAAEENVLDWLAALPDDQRQPRLAARFLTLMHSGNDAIKAIQAIYEDCLSNQAPDVISDAVRWGKDQGESVEAAQRLAANLLMRLAGALPKLASQLQQLTPEQKLAYRAERVEKLR